MLDYLLRASNVVDAPRDGAADYTMCHVAAYKRGAPGGGDFNILALTTNYASLFCGPATRYDGRPTCCYIPLTATTAPTRLVCLLFHLAMSVWYSGGFPSAASAALPRPLCLPATPSGDAAF